MTNQTRTVLKTYFNAGDQPTEAQFADLIDSAINVADTNPGVGTDQYALVWDNDTAKFVLRAPFRVNGSFTFAPVVAPGAPTIGSVSAGGLVDDGDHYYRITFVTATGETELGVVSAAATCGGGNNTVNLTAIPVSSDPLVTARKVYRGTVGAPYYRCVGTIANNTATTYTDAAANSSLPTTGSQNSWNTTAGKFYVNNELAGYLGYSNTQFGLSGMKAITTGFDNCGFGWGTLECATSGYNLTAVGVNALAQATVANHVTAVGVHAAQSLVSANHAAAFGVNAMFGKISGDYDTAIGDTALYSNSDGAENTAIGFDTLHSNLHGSRNIALGMQAGYWETGSDKLFIDNRSRASEADGREKALLYGVMDAAVANQALRINGKLGINMAPTNPNDVAVAGSIISLYPIATGAYGYYNVQNSGTQLILGVEAAAGANLFPGTTAYAAVIGTTTNRPLELCAGNAVRIAISGTGEIGFFGHAAAAQPTKAGHNNWATLADVVSALVEIGILDTA